MQQQEQSIQKIQIENLKSQQIQYQQQVINLLYMGNMQLQKQLQSLQVI